MIFFIYKCYYVFFLHFSKQKHAVPWNSAIAVLVTAVGIYLLTFMKLFGIVDIALPNTAEISKSAHKGKIILFIIPLCILIWYSINYIIFNLAEASKTDGLSERYSFTPTKRDKTICWLACLLSLALAFIIIGGKILLDQNNS